jgi:hypothetical protein
MTQQLRVTPAQVAAARLLADLDQAQGKASDPLVTAIANARSDSVGQRDEAGSVADQTAVDEESRLARTIEALEARRIALETHIAELREFEREYRTRLKSYLESQLKEMEITPAVQTASLEQKIEDLQAFEREFEDWLGNISVD